MLRINKIKKIHRLNERERLKEQPLLNNANFRTFISLAFKLKPICDKSLSNALISITISF